MKTSYRHSMNLFNRPFWYTGQNISFNSNYKIQKYFLSACCKSSFIGLLWITSKQIDCFLVSCWPRRSLAVLLAILILRPCPPVISVRLRGHSCCLERMRSYFGDFNIYLSIWKLFQNVSLIKPRWWCIYYFHCDVGGVFSFFISTFPLRRQLLIEYFCIFKTCGVFIYLKHSSKILANAGENPPKSCHHSGGIIFKTRWIQVKLLASQFSHKFDV